jgi:hypothetical protein
MASIRLLRASSLVRPCPLAPGTSGQNAKTQSSSRSKTAVNSLRMFHLTREGGTQPQSYQSFCGLPRAAAERQRRRDARVRVQPQPRGDGTGLMAEGHDLMGDNRMPGAGLEPARDHSQRFLRPPRLPLPPPRQDLQILRRLSQPVLLGNVGAGNLDSRKLPTTTRRICRHFPSLPPVRPGTRR